MSLPIKTVPFYMTKKEYISVGMSMVKPARYLAIPVYGLLVGLLLTFTAGLTAGLTYGGVVLLVGLLLPLVRYRQLSASVNNPNTAWVIGETRTMEFYEDCLIVNVANGVMSRVPWTVINKAEVKSECLVLLMGRQWFMLPVRAMGTAEERLEILNLLKAKGLKGAALPETAETPS